MILDEFYNLPVIDRLTYSMHHFLKPLIRFFAKIMIDMYNKYMGENKDNVKQEFM